MGNSEVGHLNIGAGRVVWQDVVRIDQSIKKGDFSQRNESSVRASLEAAERATAACHLCGLISHGGGYSRPQQPYGPSAALVSR